MGCQMKVLVAGATGVLGRALMQKVREHGDHAVALTRDGPGRNWLEEKGFDYEICDVFSGVDVKKAVQEVAPDVLINQLTSIPQNLNPRRVRTQMSPTNRLRHEATKNLVAALPASSRLISQSIAFAYHPRVVSPATESDSLYIGAPSGFDEVVDAILECEKATLATNGTVLRYGHFCGPETAFAPDGSTTRAVASRQLPIIGNGTGEFSFIHRDDAVDATIAAMTSEASGIFNIVDNTPVTADRWIAALAEDLGATRPPSIPAWLGILGAGRFGAFMMLQQRGASNARARGMLDWTPNHPTWRHSLELKTLH